MSEEISKGSIVVVESRTWPGSNKPGGVARVTAVHDADNDDGTANANTTTSPKKKKKRYDVSYVLGGKEKGVDEEHVTLQSSLSGGGDDKKKRSSGGGDLRISPSTASLALSAISSLKTAISSFQTPKNVDIDEPTTNFPHPNPAIEERRKRKNSIQEDILLGDDSQSQPIRSVCCNGNVASAGVRDRVKKIKIETAADDAETSHDDDDDYDDCASSLLQNHHKTAIWSARKHLEIKDKSATTTTTAAAENDLPSTAVSSTSTASSLKRWRSHQIAEDYISLASALVLPPTTHLNTTSFGYVPHLGQYPIEQVTALGYLTSPLRRPTVIEKWSPYEITTFEAALALHGKHFHLVQKWVKTKNTKEIIEFYYIWKKTSHYRRWKCSFCEEMAESVCSSDEGEDEEMMEARGGEEGGNTNK